ncbi:MAG: hypothetical protein JO225_05885, partial [Candidatus Eremiobacteraeota bacterium]|nr:hypothetical protein [Candidatus Eremiobacteraeota bacterium]
MTVRIAVAPQPAVAPRVRWSSPDGMNAFGGSNFNYGRDAHTSAESSGTESVAVYPRGRIGDAILVADIGPPVNQRATLHVRDVDGLGFGCYGFLGQGQSIRFVNGHPQRSSLAEADVAIVGPGRYEGTIPGYGCWGENFRDGARDYTMIFGVAGRDERPGSRAFVKDVSTSSFASSQIVDVRTHEGGMVQMHLLGGPGYFMGWSEPFTGPAAAAERTAPIATPSPPAGPQNATFSATITPKPLVVGFRPSAPRFFGSLFNAQAEAIVSPQPYATDAPSWTASGPVAVTGRGRQAVVSATALGTGNVRVTFPLPVKTSATVAVLGYPIVAIGCGDI